MTRLVIHLVWPHQQDTPTRGLGLSGSIHEEAHLSLSNLIQSIFKNVETGRPNCLPVQPQHGGMYLVTIYREFSDATAPSLFET